MIRLFTGLELPLTLRERLAALGAGIPNAHWVPEENLHVTLRFIGEVDEIVANDLHDALAGIRAPGFNLVVSGIGTFGSGRQPRTLWAGIERTAPLVHLRDKIESALVRAGQEPEGRKFTPHVTLARLKNAPASRLEGFIAAHCLLRAEVPIRRFALFSSRQGNGQAVYTPEAEYPLRD